MAQKKESLLDQGIDFGILTAKEMRDVLKSKAHCLRAGFPADHMIITTLNEFREHYIKRAGLATYLSQMLGPFGKTAMQYCKLYAENGQPINVQLDGAHNQPVQRFIARRFSVETLPFRVEIRIRPGSEAEHIEVRYL